MVSHAPLHLNSLQSSRDCWWTIERGIGRQPEPGYISLSVGLHGLRFRRRRFPRHRDALFQRLQDVHDRLCR
jgi:hypothetical protein